MEITRRVSRGHNKGLYLNLILEWPSEDLSFSPCSLSHVSNKLAI